MHAPPSSPFASGLNATLRHRRLAGILWLSLVASAAVAWLPLAAMTRSFDDSPFRETLMKGWDSWGVFSWLLFKNREWALFRPAMATAFFAGLLLQLFLTSGIVRVLFADVARPVLRRTVAESAALFRPTLWAFFRFLLTLGIWEALLVAAPVKLFGKIAGETTPPNGPLSTLSELWVVVFGTLVFFNIALRFDLARVALAKDDAPSARGAYRVAKERLRGSRGSAIGLFLLWLVVGLLVQGLFTNLGVRMNPGTNGGVFALVVFRQFGFFVLAMTRIGFWASLLEWEKARRPVPLPPVWERAAAPSVEVLPSAGEAPAPPQSVLG